jgi:uncharacterized protein (TIGR02300 family)
VAKTELGTKRTCLSCGARFYDLRKTPISCPKCDSEFSPDDFVVKRRQRPAPLETKASEKVVAPKAAAESDVVVEDEEETVDDDISDIEEEDEDDVIEDTSDLGEDDDDMAEVLEHTEGEDKE